MFYVLSMVTVGSNKALSIWAEGRDEFTYKHCLDVFLLHNSLYIEHILSVWLGGFWNGVVWMDPNCIVICLD